MRKLITVLLSGVVLAGNLFSCATVSAATNATVLPGIGPAYVASLPKQPLSKQEIKDLLHMREEEKLARDVYTALYEMWQMPVFRNIARSEQRHMDMLKFLIDRYNLEDPVARTGDKLGKFENKKLQRLYTKLVKQGSKSLIDALEVGATIEDLDIKDLQDALKRTDNRDIATVYENLMKGSRNHMRAFTAILRRYGIEYKPKFITPAEYRAIVGSKHEAGVVYGDNGRSVAAYQTITVSGRVTKVYQRPGYGNKRVIWWVVEVKTPNGKEEIAVAPIWLYPSLDIVPGDTIEVAGYVPPFWRFRNIKGLMACTIKNPKRGVTYKIRNCNRLNRKFKLQNR
ncbi:DUF2202 domain-containing protein [Desulfurobacterium sp. TC5-1]|uniref:DUF2202 domain-containing protein n=1 Tax=Desulfurobacterium sp. TC5-1 TaxID=1158318 RepID=UPI0003B530F0|nr:DUF2202 domain-containing protein [Desulfurobacterium sp. TC5-1]